MVVTSVSIGSTLAIMLVSITFHHAGKLNIMCVCVCVCLHILTRRLWMYC
jgi:hypothetical protein